MAFRPEHEIHKRRFSRNLGVGLTLAAFIALVFALTVAKVTGEAKLKHNADGSVQGQAE